MRRSAYSLIGFDSASQIKSAMEGTYLKALAYERAAARAGLPKATSWTTEGSILDVTTK